MDSADIWWLGAPLAPYAGGALLAILFGRRRGGLWAVHLAALLGGVAGVAVAWWHLLAGAASPSVSIPVTPFAQLAFRLDPLSAVFLLVISAVAIPVALYAPDYVGKGHGSPTGLGLALHGFVASMVLVVLADGVLAFMLAWELMSLVSFFLVVEDHLQPESRRAGFVYLTMTHVGGAFILAAFLALAAAGGGLDFALLRAGAARLPMPARDAVFLAALVGFGTKAGIIPLHVWLPRAHPAAPSYVSALMSGVMIKLGVYGLLRVGWDLAGPGPTWWGGLVAALGAVSAVLGVLYALMEHDLKRLLAYHSVENVGIILLGVGAGFLLASLGRPEAAAVALSAGLLHTLNHALFKGLLFLGAGAVLRAVHTRDLEKLGGLIHRMPWTAATFLIGSAAISALPPLNGFASEWLTFRSLLALTADGPIVAVGVAVAAALLALTSGLAVFCFVKAFGVAFLGMARSDAAAAATEVGWPMRAAMVVLAAPCIGLGLVPSAALSLFGPATTLLVARSGLPSWPLAVAPAGAPASGFVPLALLGVLAVLALLALVLGRLIGGPARERVAPPWVCGIAIEPGMQYTATALAKPIRIIFSMLLRPYRAIERQHALAPYLVSGVRYEAGMTPIYERYFYRRIVAALVWTAHRLLAIQNGSLRTYLGYAFATLVVILILAR